MKEDYYIQQLNSQSTWIVVFVTSLFALFSVIEIGIFMDKIKASQQEQIKQNEGSEKKIHDIELGFRTLKNDLHVDFSRFTHDNDKRYLELQIGNYYQGSNTLFLASKTYYEKNKFIEALNVVADALRYQFQLIKILGNDPRGIDVIKTAKMHLEDSIGYFGLIIPDQALKSEFQKVSNHGRVVEAFNDMLGFNHPELRDQLVDILGLIKLALKNEDEENAEPMG